MSTRVVTIGMDHRLSDVKQIFDNVKFHHLVVLDDDNKVVGVVTENLLLAAMSPYIGLAAEQQRDLETLNKRVHQIMIREPKICSVIADIPSIGRWFVEQDIGCVPVTDAQGCLQGIVTWRDIMQFLLVQQSNS